MCHLEVTYADSPDTQAQWDVDSHCVVRNPNNNKWYRGKVLERTGDMYKVRWAHRYPLIH